MADARFIQVILPLKLDWEPYYRVPGGMEVHMGTRVRVLFANSFYVGAVSAVDVTPQLDLGKIQPIEAVEEGLPVISAEEIRFWRQIASYYLCSIGEVYKAAYPNMKNHQSRLKLPGSQPPQESIVLTPRQEEAAAAIRQGWAGGKTVLLHGITGSGKTEIFLQLALEAFREGKSILYLVPEIALSSQLEERIGKVFPSVLIYHSGQSPAKRKLVAEKLRTGEPCLVLGTRSALFLPHHALGLVIVDEEHDTSYKQDAPAPRYHARESAIMLAGVHGAHVVLGSATPSLESLYNARCGRFVKVQLKERFHSGEDAPLQIINTVAERRKRGMVGSFSLKLLGYMKDTLDQGGQILLLRSRRSYAPAVQCTECGHIPKCPHCNVSLSLHRHPDRLLCHYCGHSVAYTGVCSQCGGPLQPLGAGTQKIEEEVLEYFPEARIARLDSDKSEEEADTIRDFAAGQLDILIGTQIITKGFDFGNLSLVAVIQADNILGQHDFRADERALQLLQQFRGRSGRRGKPALFVIQTREPDHPVFLELQDGADRTEDLLQERQAFGYPPFTRLVRLQIRDKNEHRLNYLSHELAAALLSETLLSNCIVGPYAPVVDRIADEYIREIRLMLPRDSALQARKTALSSRVTAFERDRRYNGHIVIDVDPV